MTVELDFMLEGCKHLDYFRYMTVDELPLPWFVCFVGHTKALDDFEPELLQLTGELLKRDRFPCRMSANPDNCTYSMTFWATVKQASLIKLIYG